MSINGGITVTGTCTKTVKTHASTLLLPTRYTCLTTPTKPTTVSAFRIGIGIDKSKKCKLNQDRRWRVNSRRRDRDGEQIITEQCPVPLEQLPLNEYQALSKSYFFSWAHDDFWKYGLRLGGICTAFTVLIGTLDWQFFATKTLHNQSEFQCFADILFIVNSQPGSSTVDIVKMWKKKDSILLVFDAGWPVARVSVNPEHELFKCGIGALGGGLLIVTLVALRMYLGWAYIGNRLLSATVEYEESGWYDGEVWVKPPEVLARDRLLGSYTVKPILNRVKTTLITLAMLLFSCIVVFVNLQSPRVNQPVNLEVDQPQSTYDEKSASLFELDMCFGGDQENLPDL